MKRIIAAVSIVLLSSAFAKAQFVVGGGLRFGHTGGKTEINNNESDLDKTNNFGIYPKVGYFISSDFMVGGKVGLILSTVKDGDTDVKTKNTTFVLAPFARYYALRMNKFSVYAEGNVTYSFGKDKVDGVDGTKTTSIGLNVYPGIGYDLSDKVLLSATINGLSLYAGSVIKKTGDNKEVNNNLGLGVNLDNVVTSGLVTISVLVKL